MRRAAYYQRRRRPGGWSIWPRRLFFIALGLGLGAACGLAATFYYFSTTLPAIGPLLEGYDPPQTSRILAADGTVIGELFYERRTVVPVREIPPVMIDAVIASEDADFFEHAGLDYMGMVRALIANLSSGRRAQGASTITQQVARTFFLSREKTYSRKIREILLTRRIEEQLSKDEILYLYLNQINFGHARYGVHEAARFYFDKDVAELSLDDAALLAGIPKGPALYSPVSHPEAARRRRAYVLDSMVKTGAITKDAAEQAKAAPLSVTKTGRLNASVAPEAVSRALKEIADAVHLETLRRGGYTIHTTLDLEAQAAAREAVLAGLIEIDDRHGHQAPFSKRRRWPKAERNPKGPLREGRTYAAVVRDFDGETGRLLVRIGRRRGVVDLTGEQRYNPKKLPLARFAERGTKLAVTLARPARDDEPAQLRLAVGAQAALIALRAEDGAIIALIGGDLPRAAGFNRAVRARRQPGSVFKPFVYLAALRTRGYTPATLLDDAPEVQGAWRPSNSHPDELAGAIRMRPALARSLNLPTIKLATEIGPESVAALARELGIASPLDPVPALALGASAVTPLEIAGAYRALAAAGRRRHPWIVERVVEPTGAELPLLGRLEEQVVSPEEAYLITSMMISVVREGTGAKAGRLRRPVAGKTGTSNDQKDAWFAGFTRDYVCAVWVGYDDLRPIGRKEYGSRAALPIWIDFMQAVHRSLPPRDFEPPPGLVTARIDPATGLLAYEGQEDAIEEIFLEGTEPTAAAVPPDLVDPMAFLFDQATGDAGVEIDTGTMRQP